MKIRIVFVLVSLVLSALTGCTFLKVSMIEEVQPFQEQVVSGRGKDKVLILDISGVIMAGESGAVPGGKTKPGLLASVRESLDRARKDDRIKAVVLRISSPGGGVTASDMLYQELKRFHQETGKVLLAHITDVGASGAYYAALAAGTITAQPTSVVGSIGVIMYRVDVTSLLQKLGIQAAEISSGDKKSLGSPFRPLADDERKLFQGFIDSLFARFTGLVASERKLSPDAVKKAADGRIMTSQEAKSLGLIDGIGYLDDAVESAKKKAGISDATVVMYVRPGEYRTTIYSQSLINIDFGGFTEPGAQFLYLWWP